MESVHTLTPEGGEDEYRITGRELPGDKTHSKIRGPDDSAEKRLQLSVRLTIFSLLGYGFDSLYCLGDSTVSICL